MEVDCRSQQTGDQGNLHPLPRLNRDLRIARQGCRLQSELVDPAAGFMLTRYCCTLNGPEADAVMTAGNQSAQGVVKINMRIVAAARKSVDLKSLSQRLVDEPQDDMLLRAFTAETTASTSETWSVARTTRTICRQNDLR